jgi:hypothetical protein
VQCINDALNEMKSQIFQNILVGVKGTIKAECKINGYIHSVAKCNIRPCNTVRESFRSVALVCCGYMLTSQCNKK